MIARSNRINWIMPALFALAIGGCGNGGCGGCGSVGQLPGGILPADQTIEGGGQIRVTQQGFNKLRTLLPDLLDQQLGAGFCVPRGQVGSLAPGDTGAEYCYTNSGGCSPGCKATVQINPNGIAITPSGNELNVSISTRLSTQLTVSGQLNGNSLGTCTMTVTSNNLNGDVDIALDIDPTSGELDIHVAQINAFQLSMDFSGCGIFSDILNLAAGVLDSLAGQFAIQNGLLDSAIDGVLQSLLPKPLGIAGMIDIGGLLASVSPGTESVIEARMVPGGYVSVANNGLSLGLITGLNADRDPGTRSPALDNEVAPCVPPISAPDFAGPPWGLPAVYRSALGGSAFALAPAGAFAGTQDPLADVSIGISETTLDLAGHHLVTSGAACLAIGTRYVALLNLGTIGFLVPSLAELESEQRNDPLLLVTRPQRAIDFSIGENQPGSPALTIHLDHFEVDFYAFIYERYIRVFTLELNMDVSLNVAFDQIGTMSLIKPELVALTANDVHVKVLNSQFVRESPQDLESVLPSVFQLLIPMIGPLPPIEVPTFAGFSLNNLSIHKVVTSQDDFLALNASLGASPIMRMLGTTSPFIQRAVELLDADTAPAPPRSTGHATLRKVVTPEPAIVRDALRGVTGGALPSVTFDVDRFDAGGREIEWSWSIGGGLSRPYVSTSTLVISDPAFAWQGNYEIGLKSRVKGDYRTVSDEIRTKVVIDSVGPSIFADRATWDGDELAVPVWDVVFGLDVEVAYGRVGADRPDTEWLPAREASLHTQAAMALVDRNGELAMFARDQAGNQTIARIAPFHGQAGASGCSCETGSRPSAGGLIALAVVGIGLWRRRRRGLPRRPSYRTVKTLALWLGAAIAMSVAPACSCGEQHQACETVADCDRDACGEGELAFCIDHMCECSVDVPPGRIGPYSDVAVGGGAIWVSAYAESHGDLVVARATGGRIPDQDWEWVDGVPDGPVTIPGAMIRGGIEDAGPDVGMYTSIAVAPDGTPMVSYFDRDTASLKFAARVDGTWQTHVVEAGTGKIVSGSGALIGMYTSLTLSADDGRPGIAYLAHVADASGVHAEVRYAAAQTAVPSSAGDWRTWTVATGAVPDNPDDIYPLPGGLGLFIDSAREPQSQAPVLVYYNRSSGTLELSRFAPASDTFGPPIVLASTIAVDTGWSPSVAVDSSGVAHVAYMNELGDDFKYTTDAPGAATETIDDGYRTAGTNSDNLPKPEFHLVGDDAGIVLPAGAGPLVVYQDATTQELLLAQRGSNGQWTHVSIAGGTEPWPGAYGFFAADALDGGDIVMSTWVIDQPAEDNWVEVFTRPSVLP